MQVYRNNLFARSALKRNPPCRRAARHLGGVAAPRKQFAVDDGEDGRSRRRPSQQVQQIILLQQCRLVIICIVVLSEVAGNNKEPDDVQCLERAP